MELLEDYSYKLDLKIVGMPVLGARENAEETANLCLRIFWASTAKEVSIVYINTEHSFPARKASNKPNGIVCKLTRRIWNAFLVFMILIYYYWYEFNLRW